MKNNSLALGYRVEIVREYSCSSSIRVREERWWAPKKAAYFHFDDIYHEAAKPEHYAVRDLTQRYHDVAEQVSKLSAVPIHVVDRIASLRDQTRVLCQAYLIENVRDKPDSYFKTIAAEAERIHEQLNSVHVSLVQVMGAVEDSLPVEMRLARLAEADDAAAARYEQLNRAYLAVFSSQELDPSKLSR